MKKDKDYREKYILISDETKKQLMKFCNEADRIHKRINEVDTITLKSLLITIDNLCTDISQDLTKINDLYFQSVKLQMEYQEKLFKMSNELHIQLTEDIDDIKELINNNPEFLDVIKCRFAMAECSMKNINKLDDMCDLTDAMNELVIMLNTKIVQINIQQCCLPFSINDYGKYKAKKQLIKDAIKFVINVVSLLPPILSKILSEAAIFAELVSLIEKAANIENYDDLEVSFYNTTDDNVKVLEQQIVMLSIMKEKQKDIITYFKNFCEVERKKLESI